MLIEVLKEILFYVKKNRQDKNLSDQVTFS